MEKFTEHDPQELIKELAEEDPEFRRYHETQKPIVAAERAVIEARINKATASLQGERPSEP